MFFLHSTTTPAQPAWPQFPLHPSKRYRIMLNAEADRGGGGGGHRTPPPPLHSTAIYKCRSIRISFRLGGLRSMKVAISSFFGGGGGRGVRGSRNLGGSSASFKLSTTKDSHKLMIHAVFLFRNPPSPSF